MAIIARDIREMSRLLREMQHVAHALDSVVMTNLADQMNTSGQQMVEYAKGMFGHYDHPGDWPELSPVTQADRERLGYPPNEPLLREGTLRDSYSHEVLATPSAIFLIVGSDDVRSIFNELGTATMPPRPVLMPTANAFEQEMEDILGEKVAKALFVRLDNAFARLAR